MRVKPSLIVRRTDEARVWIPPRDNKSRFEKVRLVRLEVPSMLPFEHDVPDRPWSQGNTRRTPDWGSPADVRQASSRELDHPVFVVRPRHHSVGTAGDGVSLFELRQQNCGESRRRGPEQDAPPTHEPDESVLERKQAKTRE